MYMKDILLYQRLKWLGTHAFLWILVMHDQGTKRKYQVGLVIDFFDLEMLRFRGLGDGEDLA